MVFGFVTEIIGILGVIGILYLISVRLRNRPGRARGLSRFTGSTMWQGYFVEWIIVGVLVCGFLIRGFKAAERPPGLPDLGRAALARPRLGAAGLGVRRTRWSPRSRSSSR